MRLIIGFCLLTLVMGCSYRMTVSAKKDASSAKLTLNQGVTLESTGAVNVHMPPLINHEDFLPASVLIRANGRTLYIDPAMVEATAFADDILLTHPHADHLSLPDLKKLSGPGTRIYCPAEVAAQLKGFTNLTVVSPGDRIDGQDWKALVVPAYNLKPVFLGFKPHAPENRYAGYVITVNNNTIYHPGDTHVLPEHRALTNLTVAMLPIDGSGLTMSTAEAAELVNAIRPRYAVPVHYALKTNVVEEFQRLVKEPVEVFLLQKKG